MKSIIKNIFSLLPILLGFGVFLKFKDITKNDLLSLSKGILILISPIITIFTIGNILILIFSFVFWHFPDNFYIPFCGTESQTYFDRFLLLLGLILLILY